MDISKTSPDPKSRMEIFLFYFIDTRASPSRFCKDDDVTTSRRILYQYSMCVVYNRFRYYGLHAMFYTNRFITAPDDDKYYAKTFEIIVTWTNCIPDSDDDENELKLYNHYHL